MISLFAAIVSVVVLWLNQFSKGHLIWAVGQASMSIVKMESEEEEWFVPDLAIPVSIANTGTRPVTVKGLRLRVRYRDLPVTNAFEIWNLNYELDLDSHLPDGKDRTAFIAIKSSTGTPFIVLPKTNVNKRFLFDCRWEKQVFQDFDIDLEFLSSKSKKWESIETWRLRGLSTLWPMFIEDGVRLHINTESQGMDKVEINPPNLHDYTNIRSMI